jgi:hypothetical protein
MNYAKNISVRLICALTFFILTTLYFFQCDKNAEKFTLGEDYVDSQTSLNLIDTFSVNLSTLLLDSVVTSGTEALLVGNYRDNVCGYIRSSGYFQIGIPSSFDADTIQDDTYDSLCLTMKYSGYVLGDTTIPQKFYLHQLSENIETEDNFRLTSKTSFDYYSEPIGTITFRPDENKDSISLRINDDIGLDLFTKIKNNSDIVTDTENFLDYFHGLVVIADESNQNCILGFDATAATLKMVLYTTGYGEELESNQYIFGMETTAKQFNNISHDFSGTPLSQLSDQKKNLSAAESGGQCYLHGGIGLGIKIEFPSLPEILLQEVGIIQKAKLIISPLPGSNNDFDLPTYLSIYESTEDNYILYDEEVVASAEPVIDDLYHEETAYTFDITNFITEQFYNSYFDPDKNLLLSLPTAYLNSTFNRMITDVPAQSAKLKLYYVSY